MAILSKSAFGAKYGTTGTIFPDNTTGEISEADMRGFGQDITDSLFSGTVSGLTSGYITATYLQVLASNATPIELVAAVGEGLLIVPVFPFVVHIDYQTTAYTTNTNFRFEIGGVAISGSDSTLLTQTADSISFIYNAAVGATSVATMANQPLVFKVQSGDPQDGDSPIAISFNYKVLDVNELI